MYVVVPPGDEAQAVSCPICKETLKAEFLEDDEEWVWRNAVRKDDKVRIIHILGSSYLTYGIQTLITDIYFFRLPRRFSMRRAMRKRQPLSRVLPRDYDMKYRDEAEVVRKPLKPK